MAEHTKRARFESTIVPHLDAGYNLARWLTRNDLDAQDVVQEAFLRAFTSLDGFRGGDGRPWLLAIVRNTYLTWLRRHQIHASESEFNEAIHSGDRTADNPEHLLIRKADCRQVTEALAALPAEYREVVVLRELEELSYKEIAHITGAPIGTVMSRLSRGRECLRRLIAGLQKEQD